MLIADAVLGQSLCMYIIIVHLCCILYYFCPSSADPSGTISELHLLAIVLRMFGGSSSHVCLFDFHDLDQSGALMICVLVIYAN